MLQRTAQRRSLSPQRAAAGFCTRTLILTLINSDCKKFIDIFRITGYIGDKGVDLKISFIDWDEDTIGHIARHGVEPEEAEEICFRNNPFILKSGYNRYYCLGQTKNGRYLTVIFEYPGKNKAKIIPAGAMSGSEHRPGGNFFSFIFAGIFKYNRQV